MATGKKEGKETKQHFLDILREHMGGCGPGCPPRVGRVRQLARGPANTDENNEIVCEVNQGLDRCFYGGRALLSTRVQNTDFGSGRGDGRCAAFLFAAVFAITGRNLGCFRR